MALNDAALPRNIKWELARIAQFPTVAPESVTYAVDEAGCSLISFTLETDVLVDGEPAADIRDVEPISLRYLDSDLVGRGVPEVLSARDDFPRDLQHINPGADDRPVSLCLARSNLQGLYDAQGIAGVLVRLSSWLTDAKTGRLAADGWDPTPMAAFDNCVLGYLDAKALQEHAATHPNGGYAFLKATVSHGDEDKVFLQCGFPILDTSNGEDLSVARAAMQQANQNPFPFNTAVPAIFCWPGKESIETKPHYHRWTDILSLKAGLEVTELWKEAESASLSIEPLFREDPFAGSPPDADKKGRRSFVLITGLWRPLPLDPTIVGLSDDEQARRLELRAYYLDRPLDENDHWSEKNRVRPFYALVPRTPDILQSVSGVDAVRNPAFIGAGALGSAMIDYALRGGTEAVTVIDDDILMSHNLARHRGEADDIRFNKAKVARRLALTRAQDVKTKCVEANFTILSDEDQRAALDGCGVVIDATANPAVRTSLSSITQINAPVVRTEIFYQGRLGVTLATRLGSPHSLNVLYRQLIGMAGDEEIVRDWLRYEDTRAFHEEELILGFGCRSLTTKMPAYEVDAHAAAAFALTRKTTTNPDQPMIGLHPLDTDGTSLGVRKLQPEPIEVFEGGPAQNGWRVAVNETAMKAMQAQRREKTPNETGGYLYGAIDEAAKEIVVIWASPEPPGTIGTPTKLTLGPQGETGIEKAFLRRTCRRLPPIGAWHAHPAGMPKASVTDKKTLDGFKAIDAARGLPTVMMITGATSDEAYVVEP